MKTKIYVAIMTLMMMFIACGNKKQERVEEGRKAYKAYFKKNSRNPSSFIVYGEEYEYKEDQSFYTIKWTLDIGLEDVYGIPHRLKAECETSPLGFSIKAAGRTHYYSYSELRPYMETP